MREGNTLFLVCNPCRETGESDYGVKLATRSRVGYFVPDAPTKQFGAWLAKHRKCGGRNNPDHFKLGHLFDINGDQPKERPLPTAVHNAVNGSA